MIQLKSPKEIEIMREGGAILGEVMKIILGGVKSGVKLAELDKIAQSEIMKRGAEPSFKKVKGYRFCLCACVNDVVVHGIPTDYTLKKEDVVGIDCGVYYKGFHTDAAWTMRVKDSKFEKRNKIDRFLSVGKKALSDATAQVKVGNYIYDISKAIQDNIELSDFSVVRTLVGHGVGRQLHEEPEIPGFVKDERLKTPKIVEGMTLAIEVIYNMGSSDVVYKGNDGWTIATKDGKISALFEATVAVVSHGCIVLTPIQSRLT